jgi:hypothetical protein
MHVYIWVRPCWKRILEMGLTHFSLFNNRYVSRFEYGSKKYNLGKIGMKDKLKKINTTISHMNQVSTKIYSMDSGLNPINLGNKH